MTAMTATPRLELIDSLIDAGLEVDRHLGQLRNLNRRLVETRRDLAGPGARTPGREAYLRRAEDKYDELLGRLHAARREAQALAQID